MASWRGPGSILEVPGLDFGGFWDQFFEYFRRRPVRKCFLPQVRCSSKVWANCSQIVGFPFPICLQQCSPADASLKGMAVPQHSCTQMGRRRWPPLGEFNPPATEGVPTACWIHFQLALSNHSWPISTFFRAVRSRNSI